MDETEAMKTIRAPMAAIIESCLNQLSDREKTKIAEKLKDGAFICLVTTLEPLQVVVALQQPGGDTANLGTLKLENEKATLN